MTQSRQNMSLTIDDEVNTQAGIRENDEDEYEGRKELMLL
jgi:hypothetical protein